MTQRPSLHVIGSNDVSRLIAGHRQECLDVIRAAYVAHDDGATVNVRSSFLRFPDRPHDRIIALPAYLQDEDPVGGIKWIASYPGNIDAGIPRASAVLVMNDPVNGYPTTVVESSLISATRTAASAVLGAEVLLSGKKAERVGVVGTGLIARHVVSFLSELDWDIGSYSLFDLREERAVELTDRIRTHGAVAQPSRTLESTVVGSDLVVVATVASEPHIVDPALFAHHPVVLHLSLRDIGPEVVLGAYNVTDDVDHAVREGTSLHLAEQQVGHRDFVTTTIGGLLRHPRPRPTDRVAIFAPFGLGVLDLAVGRWVMKSARTAGLGLDVLDFFEGVEL